MSTLIVKHVPAVLSDDALKEFFQHYGATEVKVMQGKMKGTVFVNFKDHEAAKGGLNQLSNLKLLDKTLHAEFVKDDKAESAGEGSTKDDAAKSQGSGSMDPIAPTLGLNYPMNPFLEYCYPRPNPHIINNIMNAIVSVPKLYTQVLHLMNKMSLPPPFGAPGPAPPPLTMPDPSEVHKRKQLDDDASDSDESEIEEEEDEATKRRKKKLAKVLPPVLPIQQHISPALAAAQARGMPIPIRLGPGGDIHGAMAQSFGQQAGFGMPSHVAPAPGPASASVVSSRRGPSDEDLSRNRVPVEELKNIDKKYEQGAATRKLYLKNLAKQTSQDDLEWLFAKYFATDDALKSQLDIKLMKEGKMKNQAFVTFPTLELAQRAIQDINGFKLHDKPLIVQFGRHKEDEGK